MAIDGTAVCAGSWTSPCPGTLGAFRSEYSVVPQSRPSPLAGRTRHRANDRWNRCRPVRGSYRRELPSLYLSANEKQNRPGTGEIFLPLVPKYSPDRNPNARSITTHGRKRLSCWAVPSSDVWAIRRSRSSKRWMRCRIATTEWPLRRASSGQEMPSSLNSINNFRSSVESHPLRWQLSRNCRSKMLAWESSSVASVARTVAEVPLVSSHKDLCASRFAHRNALRRSFRATAKPRCEWRERSSLD